MQDLFTSPYSQNPLKLSETSALQTHLPHFAGLPLNKFGRFRVNIYVSEAARAAFPFSIARAISIPVLACALVGWTVFVKTVGWDPFAAC
jgi:hypothetical protein